MLPAPLRDRATAKRFRADPARKSKASGLKTHSCVRASLSYIKDDGNERGRQSDDGDGDGGSGAGLSSSGFVGEEDRVARAAFFQAGADAFHFDGETAVAQALFELFVFAGGPDGEDAIYLESGVGGGDSAVVVEAGIVRAGESGGAVVDVEEDGVELGAARCEDDGDVIDLDADAIVCERICGERGERAAIPVNHGGNDFGDDNERVRREKVERGAQSETHAESADEDARLFQSRRMAAGERCESFFRAVHAAGHEALAVGEDDVLVGAAGQLEDGAVARKRLAEKLDGFHE